MPVRKKSGAEFRFRIEGPFGPDTMPMARLSEYLAELAAILGDKHAVHFDRLAKGSVVVVSKVDAAAAGNVRDRTRSVHRQDAPADVLRAYRSLNRLLREDEATGVLKEQRAIVIRFPGREEPVESYPAIKEHGTIDGTIVSVGGKDKSVHIRLVSEGQEITGCYTSNRAIAKDLARHFDEPVRLIGLGSWQRRVDGGWSLDSFRIDAFEVLKPQSLSQSVAELRALDIAFDDGAYDALDGIRRGPSSARNGRH